MLTSQYVEGRKKRPYPLSFSFIFAQGVARYIKVCEAAFVAGRATWRREKMTNEKIAKARGFKLLNADEGEWVKFERSGHTFLGNASESNEFSDGTLPVGVAHWSDIEVD